MTIGDRSIFQSLVKKANAVKIIGMMIGSRLSKVEMADLTYWI